MEAEGPAGAGLGLRPVGDQGFAAFEAADYLMDRLKTEAPFWKKEKGPAGERWIEPRVSDYQDVDRWRETRELTR